MTDLMYLYCGFMYLFHAGMMIDGYRASSQKVGAVISMIFAPIFVPVILGLRFGEG